MNLSTQQRLEVLAALRKHRVSLKGRMEHSPGREAYYQNRLKATQEVESQLQFPTLKTS